MDHVNVQQFKSLSRKDAFERMETEINKLIEFAPAPQKDLASKEMNNFKGLFKRYLQETGPSVVWEKIHPPPKGLVVNYDEVSHAEPADIKAALDKLVVIKLNGGLGTTMGLVGPKSLISVTQELTFLDLNIQQIEHLNNKYGSNVPLVLMNSFNTHEETVKTLRKYGAVNVRIHCFNQSGHPRIATESLLPLASTYDKNPNSWYPPGHGDIYESFYNSGLLQKFIDEGKEYMFVANIDNLGATVDLHILNYLLSESRKAPCEFVMEVTDKTRADVKGGTLIEYDNRLRLLEIAQVPKQHVDEFKSVSKFRIFNTNNLWVNLKAVKRLVEKQAMDMEIIVNKKTLDDGVRIIQLETAVGAAMKNFEGAVGINVPRRRFLPVKKTSDLLLVKSNLYHMSHGVLIMSPLRQFPSVPLVQLGSFFKKVNDFRDRFETIPDLLELDHLTVSGDVTFGKGVILKGTVIIIANHGDRIDIPAGAILENKIVSGNLRILEH
ncbi:UTP--glucose-1-phosphate uridylyltransferase isoform X2 [Nematostella vectensis]|uniref:UTP--glucose-1-phosphate uridylyltransferase isoform X2 n=1 Tax=Nematostella vectensis TaxID=45351 RepID=UPI00138FE3A6|nr:UTP--glucose-1-phosphate uridylyltransferase isoform X2 [Nematostella vectensis]